MLSSEGDQSKENDDEVCHLRSALRSLIICNRRSLSRLATRRKALNGLLFSSQQVCILLATIFSLEHAPVFQWRKELFLFTEQTTLKKKGKDITVYIYLF
jgi:hypothetical protein